MFLEFGLLNIYLHTYAFTYILLIMAIIRSDIVCKSKRGQNSILTCHRGYKEEENKGFLVHLVPRIYHHLLEKK